MVIEAAGRTPRYHFTRKGKGKLAEAMPDGYEVYEDIRGQVYLRRIVPQLLTGAEVDSVNRALARLKTDRLYRSEVRGAAITIYEAENAAARIAANFGSMGFALQLLGDDLRDSERYATYQAVLRFTLVDESTRRFNPERFCFRGSVEDWIDIGPPGALAKLVAKYLPHLGKDSFYELY